MLWFSYLPLLCLSQYLSIKLKRRYLRFTRVYAVFYLFCAYTSIFTLYMPKILPYHGFFMQNTVSLYRFPLYRDIRKRCCVVFFFPRLKECLRLSLRAFRLGFEHFQHRFPKLTAKTLICALSRHLPYIAFCLPDGCSRIVIFSVALFQIFSTAQKVQSV